MNRIYCLMVSGIMVGDELRDALFEAACEMSRDRAETMDISGCEFEGRVSSVYKHGMLGTVSGHVFLAEVDTEAGSGKVDFIVNPRDMEHAGEIACIRGSFYGPRPTPTRIDN